MIAQAQRILATTTLPEARSEQACELLTAAVGLADYLLQQLRLRLSARKAAILRGSVAEYPCPTFRSVSECETDGADRSHSPASVQELRSTRRPQQLRKHDSCTGSPCSGCSAFPV